LCRYHLVVRERLMSESSHHLAERARISWGGTLLISLLDGIEFLAKHSFLPARSIILSDATADAITEKLARQVYPTRQGLPADEFHRRSLDRVNGVAVQQREPIGGLVP
jgi:hypothetical protein